ncbi:MAG: aldose 1-epimerase family protein [Planctomycetia bacterium]|nr:aldose 1-epimerase family protein [Planctomycetia bacterium]
MALKTRTVLDTAMGVYTESLDINEIYHSHNGAISFRVTKRRLRGGRRDGTDIIEVDNGCFCFTIVTTRGMSLLKGRCRDVELKWDSGVQGPVHPRYVPLSDPSGLGWLDGFSEWFVRCGLECNGSPEFNENGTLRYPLHGYIANIPARRVKVMFDTETGEITVTGVVEETRALGKRLAIQVSYTTVAGSSKLVVKDRVLNRSSVPSEFQLLYHINIGRPFLTPGAKVEIPFEEMSPRNADAAAQLTEWALYHDEKPGEPETCYYFDLAQDRTHRTKVMLVNAKGNRAVTLGFSREQFPCFTLWKMQRPNGDTYVTGLEPSVNYPNQRSFEKANGRVIPLGPGEAREFEIEIEILHNPGEIAESLHYIKRLQAGAAQKILPTPNPKWSSD